MKDWELGERGRARVILLVASLAMVATLPGRTVGLGLITEELMLDLGVTRTHYAALNLWATFLGAALLLVTGPALDRVGIRWTTALVLAGFSGAILWLANLPGPGLLLPVLVLIRGLGQSSLSLGAIAMVGKSFRKRLSVAMGSFAVVTTLFFVGAISGVGALAKEIGWRQTWMILSAVVLGIGLLVAIVIRDPVDPKGDESKGASATGMTLRQALASPALWVLTIGIGIYYFAFTGITLFSESLVVSLNFDKGIRDWFLVVLMATGLAGNLGCGWLGQRVPVLKVFGGSMLIFAGCLFGFPMASGSTSGIIAVAAALGVGSGAVAVVFFTGFAKLFGPRYLGRIQGVAQAATVAASGTGPLFFAWAFEGSESYNTAFFTLAPSALVVGIWALLQRAPIGASADAKLAD